MKCPNIVKHKKGKDSACNSELQTKRTLASGLVVRRERYCPKCGLRIWTVEMFEDRYRGEIAELRGEADKSDIERQELERELQEIKETINTLVKFGTIKARE